MSATERPLHNEEVPSPIWVEGELLEDPFIPENWDRYPAATARFRDSKSTTEKPKIYFARFPKETLGESLKKGDHLEIAGTHIPANHYGWLDQIDITEVHWPPRTTAE